MKRLAEMDHHAFPLKRTGDSSGPFWQPFPDEPIDAVVHLAGENIAAKRWYPAFKQLILNSRVHGTRELCEELGGSSPKPQVVVTASAVGYYGNRGEEILDEDAPVGEGFLPEVCRAWEEASLPAVEAGIRTVNLRIGMVLAQRGGALARLRPLFKAGLGGRLGDGRQYMSWVGLDDLVSATIFCLDNAIVQGPVNAVAPDPVTNREFTAALGYALNRPTLFPVPAFALKLAAGEMADAMLLASQRAVPGKLKDGGFLFRHPNLESALQQYA